MAQDVSAASRIDGRSYLREAALAALSAILAFVGGWWTLRLPLAQLSGLWSTDLGSEWSNSDLTLQYGADEVLARTGSLTINPYLGFPSVQDFSHLPNTGIINVAEVKALLLLGLDAVSATNMVFVLSFPLVGAATYLGFRYIGIRRVFAVLLAVGLALLPWHYYRFTHLFLANYWILPVILVWLAIVLNAQSSRVPRSTRGIALLGVACGLAIGVHEPYYAIFGVCLGVIGLLARWRTNTRGLSPVARLAILAVVPITVLTVSLAIRVSREVPAITAVANRAVDQQYAYSGHLLSLITPNRGSWTGDLAPARVIQEALRNPYPTGLGEGLGHLNLMAAVAFLVALTFAVVSLLRAGSHGNPYAAVARATTWSGLLIVALLLFVTTGFGLAVGAFATDQVRAWGRMSVLIAMLSLAILGLLLTAICQVGAGRVRTTINATAVGVLVLLALDAFTFRGQIVADVETPAALIEFDTTADAIFGTTCPILTVPWIPFPEAESETGTSTYDQFLPFLYSGERTFSFGAFSSQLGSQWAAALPTDATELAQRAKASGFCGIQLDSRALKDPAPVVDSYTPVMGQPIATAGDRWLLYSLEYVNPPVGTQLLTDALDVRQLSGFHSAELSPEGDAFQWMNAPTARIAIGNPTENATSAIATLNIGAPACADAATVSVTLDGTTITTVDPRRTGTSPQSVQVPISLQPGAIANVDITQSSPLCRDPDQPRDIGASIRFKVERRASSE
ncbi:MAG: hypothetical protein K9G24_01730 [Candidatus Nanopelagicales bacterium]|nr:hypothetical protein [Candidatus Nanopelagicales bacterium]MCF8536796.1 hypothetical protein [Candidatus Nanopelagicales bacterium]MCF8541781.1 hypothetical protein [Candidatus Nanopelagicales bacterium]MCF8556178.1 hypothetical protein [Candidatus Nanopelagicales bacterium]